MTTTHHAIGRTHDGTVVVIRIDLSFRATEQLTTTNHEPAPSPIARLSISGMTYRNGHMDGGGQIVDVLDDLAETFPGWDGFAVAGLRDTWKRWHLNDTRAGCDHMDESKLVTEDDGFGRPRISTSAPENVCAAGSGYQYGHAWLVEVMPPIVRAAVARLQSLPNNVSLMPKRYRDFERIVEPADAAGVPDLRFIDGTVVCPHCGNPVGDDELVEDDRCERENTTTIRGREITVLQHDADFETTGWRHLTGSCNKEVRIPATLDVTWTC